jgi:hypothetical protein
MKPRFALFFALILSSACVTHDLEPQLKAPRLASVTSYFEHAANDFRASDRTTFSYDINGRLVEKSYFTFDVIENEFVLFSVSTFTFSGNQLQKIVESVAGTSLIKTTTFQYSGEKLMEVYIDDEVDTDVMIGYPEENVTEVLYVHSNGRHFKYRFTSPGENIVSEQTFDESGQLSSEITNEFDSGKNPLNLLGYSDPFFSNFSVNNKTKTESAYYSSAFPTMVPTSYEYVYNDEKLPTQQLTRYKSYPNGQTVRHLKKVFDYKY